MYGCVPLRCCDFYPVWEHFPQFKYPRLGAKLQKNHTLSRSKGSRKYTVVLSGSKNLKRVYSFGSIFAEDDTRLGSKNGENYTLSSGTYPVPKTSKCPPRGSRCFFTPLGIAPVVDRYSRTLALLQIIL